MKFIPVETVPHLVKDPFSKSGRPKIIQATRMQLLDTGKYPTHKLRKMRRAQTLKAVKGQTHFTDGTPIKQSTLVDLW